uniref:Uncharacterized protein n=1 Tax=Micrurus lemniscatus lemniscatus TaxID=129467 RepID=A0A2D4IE34_MICLE
MYEWLHVTWSHDHDFQGFFCWSPAVFISLIIFGDHPFLSQRDYGRCTINFFPVCGIKHPLGRMDLLNSGLHGSLYNHVIQTYNSVIHLMTIVKIVQKKGPQGHCDIQLQQLTIKIPGPIVVVSPWPLSLHFTHFYSYRHMLDI